MAVVVAEHSPIVDPAHKVIDVRKIVPGHFAIRRLPHFFPQFGAAPGPLEDDRIVDDFLRDNFPRKLPPPDLSRHFP